MKFPLRYHTASLTSNALFRRLSLNALSRLRAVKTNVNLRINAFALERLCRRGEPTLADAQSH